MCNFTYGQAQAKGKTETEKQRRRNDNRCLLVPAVVVLTSGFTTPPTMILPNFYWGHASEREYIRSFVPTLYHHSSSAHSAPNSWRQEWLSQRYVTITLTLPSLRWWLCDSEVRSEVLSCGTGSSWRLRHLSADRNGEKWWRTEKFELIWINDTRISEWGTYEKRFTC